MTCSRPLTARGSRAERRRASRYRSAAFSAGGATSAPVASAWSARSRSFSSAASSAAEVAAVPCVPAPGERMRYQATGTARSSAATPTSHHGLPAGACGGGAARRPLAASCCRRQPDSRNRRTRCSESGLCRKRCTEPSVICAASAPCSAAPPATISTRSGNCARRRAASCTGCGGERCGIEHRQARMVGHERGRQIDLRADRAHGVGGLGNLAQQGEEFLVLREHDQRC